MAHLGSLRLVLLLVCCSAYAYAQQNPYSIYRNCYNNLFNCQTSRPDFCSTYDITCSYQATPGNYYNLLINVYCSAWCRTCSSEHAKLCKHTPTTPLPTGKKCEYSKYNGVNPRIFGGDSPQQCDNSWMVALYNNSSITGSQRTPICQGVLLDEETVATSMTCLNMLTRNGIYASNIYATVGEYIPGVRELAEHTIVATISNVDYGSRFAKLKLKSAVSFNKCVSPACLPSTNKDIDYKKCKIVGWGNLIGNNRPVTLKEADVIVAGDNECQSIATVALQNQQIGFVSNFNADVTGCTSLVSPANGHVAAACWGDEGAAVTCEEISTREQILVGLVLDGGCNSLPTTFFTKTSNLH